MKFRILIVILIASALQNFSYAASLKDAFSDHFLMGTIWHGHALGNNSTKRFLEKEKTITNILHYIILSNGILTSNSSIFPRSKGYITQYTP